MKAIYDAKPITTQTPSAPPCEPVRWVVSESQLFAVVTDPHRTAFAARADVARRRNLDPMDLHVTIAPPPAPNVLPRP